MIALHRAAGRFAETGGYMRGRMLFGFMAVFAVSCGPQPQGGAASQMADEAEEETASAVQPFDPDSAALDLEAMATGNTQVEFTVTTNIPLPVEAMASVSLADQAGDEVYIGFDKRVTLDKPETVFTLTGDDAKKLPAGDYIAEISYYQRWGSENGNAGAAGVSDMEAQVPLKLKGFGGGAVSAEAAKQKDEMQRWVMGNLGMNEDWDPARFEARLGPSRKGPSTLSKLHDAYYYPQADVTLIVNRVRNEMTIWRLGEQTQ